MQNDERDTPDSPSDEPPSQPSSDEANEFETASWPTEDAGSPEPAADASDASQAAEEPAASDAAAEAGAGAAAAANAEPDTEAAEPPPAEVEAYGAAAAASSTGVAAHSVPATEPGESTQCPRCGTENRPGIAFCSNCGQRLVAAGAAATVARPEAPEGTQACPRCGTHNRAGVAFCQNCGANLRAAEPGHVPPAAAGTAAAATGERERTGHAVLGPVVLLVGAVGMATGWLLPVRPGHRVALRPRLRRSGGLWHRLLDRLRPDQRPRIAGLLRLRGARSDPGRPAGGAGGGRHRQGHARRCCRSSA